MGVFGLAFGRGVLMARPTKKELQEKIRDLEAELLEEVEATSYWRLRADELEGELGKERAYSCQLEDVLERRDARVGDYTERILDLQDRCAKLERALRERDS